MYYLSSTPAFRPSIDGFVDSLFRDFPLSAKINKDKSLHLPPVNIFESRDKYAIDLIAPGFQKSDFQIKVEGSTLSINADKKENENQELKMIRKEFSTRTFTRIFSLDDKMDAEGIEANYENGILLISIPKKENKEVKSIAVS